MYLIQEMCLTHDAMLAAGIREDLIRVSVGIENIGDIQADFVKGLKAAQRLVEQSGVGV